GYLRAVAAQYADRVERFLDEMASIAPAWGDSFTISDWPLRLTAEQAGELHGEIFALLDRYRRDDREVEQPEGTERVVVQVQILPFPEAEQ
ncbi:MAG TPA: hypothetical protein VGP16_32335, partial [Asanoa sp.]|nr:hypothetical protein [Asanoa sp.]